MSEEDDILWILECLSRGDFMLSSHAVRRMKERNVLMSDICAVGQSAITCRRHEIEDKWKITGLDASGEDLVVVCVLVNRVLIVTVY